GDDVSQAVRAEREAGARGGVAEVREIDDQERRDERAEAVDERAAQEDPHAGGKCAELVAEAHARLRRDVQQRAKELLQQRLVELRSRTFQKAAPCVLRTD